jgi:MFS family permease
MEEDPEKHPFVISSSSSSSLNDANDLSHLSIVERLMDYIPYGRLHYRMLAIMAFLHGSFGLAFTADALGLSALQQVYSISDVESGGLVSAIAVGLLVMCPIAGLVSDSIGRKKVILFGVIVSFLSCLFKSFVPTFQWQITLRIFQGAAAACVWVPAPVMMAEIMPKHVRGPLTILYSVGWPIFSGISALMGYYLLPSGSNGGLTNYEKDWWMYGWQWYFFLSSLPMFITVFLVYYFIYESPRYHASVGHYSTAKHLIEEMYAMNGQISPAALTVVSWKNYKKARKPHSHTLPNGHNSSTLQYRRLCCSSETLCLYAIWIFKAGGSWGASFWMPTYVERRIKLDALNEIKRTVGQAYYVNTMTSTTPYRLLVFQSLCDAVGIALAALLVNKLGRKFVSLFFLLVFSIFYSYHHTTTTIILPTVVYNYK